jgi:hypothetical protein
MNDLDFQEEDLAYLKSAVNQQPKLKPSNRVRAQVMTRVVGYKPRAFNPVLSLVTRWAAGIAISILVFAVLWQVAIPGVELNWSVNVSMPATFRIYRSPHTDSEPVLVQEIQVQANGKDFHFVDKFIPPALMHTYIIEGVDPTGETIDSKSLSVDTSNVLLTQLAILAVSLLLGWEIVMASSFLKPTFFNTLTFV